MSQIITPPMRSRPTKALVRPFTVPTVTISGSGPFVGKECKVSQQNCVKCV